MNEQVGPKAFWRNLKNEAPDWAEMLPALPRKLNALVDESSISSYNFVYQKVFAIVSIGGGDGVGEEPSRLRADVQLELYENNVVKYYTYGSRGHSVLLFEFKLEDIEQIKSKKRPFNCSKLTIKIKNPVFYGFHEKKLNKLMNASIITDRKKSEFFMQQMVVNSRINAKRVENS